MTERKAGDAAFVETPDVSDLARREAAWLDLAARAAEPNAFAESDFAIPALVRLAPPGRVATLMVWSDAAREKLIGVAADRIFAPAARPGARLAQRTGGARRGSPRSRRGAPALSAIVAWLRRERRGVAGLLLPSLETNGPIARALETVAARESLRLEIVNRRRRAALPAGPTSAFRSRTSPRSAERNGRASAGAWRGAAAWRRRPSTMRAASRRFWRSSSADGRAREARRSPRTPPGRRSRAKCSLDLRRAAG